MYSYCRFNYVGLVILIIFKAINKILIINVRNKLEKLVLKTILNVIKN